MGIVLFIYLDPVLTRTQVFPLFRRYLPIALIIPYHPNPYLPLPHRLLAALARCTAAARAEMLLRSVRQVGRKSTPPFNHHISCHSIFQPHHNRTRTESNKTPLPPAHVFTTLTTSTTLLPTSPKLRTQLCRCAVVENKSHHDIIICCGCDRRREEFEDDTYGGLFD